MHDSVHWQLFDVVLAVERHICNAFTATGNDGECLVTRHVPALTQLMSGN